MIRISHINTDAGPSLEPFTPLSEEARARRRELLRATAGCWSKEDADHITHELQRLFASTEHENGVARS